MQPLNLPSKFAPYILNDQFLGELGNLKVQLDAIFQNDKSLSSENGFNPIDPKKPHTVTHPNLGGWVIKGQRNDRFSHLTTSDTHIYRVRRAYRIQEAIMKYGLSTVTVPDKYLYRAGCNWYVIARKLYIHADADISGLKPNYGNPNRKPAARFKNSIEGFRIAELVILCFKGGLQDVTESNLHQHIDGRIAILDTEPLSRCIKKTSKTLFIPNRIFWGFKKMWNFKDALSNSNRVLQYAHGGINLEPVKQIQKYEYECTIKELIKGVVTPILIAFGLSILTLSTHILAIQILTNVAVTICGIYSFVHLKYIDTVIKDFNTPNFGIPK